MRSLFYSLAGIAAALIGWNLSLLLRDLIKLILKLYVQIYIPFKYEFILFPIVASCLSLALVFTTIYLSNPTHYKANRRIRNDYLKMAGFTGILAGLISALITVIIYQTGWEPWSIRVVGWGLIGLGIGFAEGLCWLFLSVEGANSPVKTQLIKSPLFGLAGGLIAAMIIELIRGVIKLGGYEDPLGFIILGSCLGIAFTISTAPTYQVALRAGRGFGTIDPKTKKESNQAERPYPKIRNSSLSLVYRTPEQTRIEEGLSIQLSGKIAESLVIGSSEEADIFLPYIPAKAARLTLEQKQWKLTCLADRKVQIQRRLILENSRPTPLHHNQILTFYYEDNNDQYYRFIFYDRFLDPSS